MRHVAAVLNRSNRNQVFKRVIMASSSSQTTRVALKVFSGGPSHIRVQPEEKEQLATVQMDALNTVCLQFADADKKTLKRKLVEVSNARRSDRTFKSKMKIGVWEESTNELEEVRTVLEKGTETGLTLSPETVKRLCKHLEECREHIDELT